MDGADLAFAGVAKQARLVRDGEVSSRELVELCLERIGRLDGELNAFRVVFAEKALAEADEADARARAGDARPVLGVPLAVKDDQDVAGEVTARGTSAYGPPAREDAELVRRLRAAGSVIVGKTNVPELEIMGATESISWGVTRSPWDPERTPGGSSGGSAAAVAAGMVPAATGADGTGSLRIPAACCGLVALKPQRGRISPAHLRELWHGLGVYGFLTRSVADTALLLDVASGPAPTDPEPRPLPPPRPYVESAAERLGALRIAVSLRPPLAAPPPHRQVRQAVEATADFLRSLGHAVERRDPDYGQAATATTIRYLRGIRDGALAMPRPERLQRRTRGFARLGGLFPDRVLRWARAREPVDSARINRIFEQFDVMLSPTIRTPPLRATEWEGRGAFRTLIGMAQAYPYTGIWNMTGQPAIAVPAGFTSDGLPLSVQLVGRPNDEGTLLALAAQLEARAGSPQRRPAVS